MLTALLQNGAHRSYVTAALENHMKQWLPEDCAKGTHLFILASSLSFVFPALHFSALEEETKDSELQLRGSEPERERC